MVVYKLLRSINTIDTECPSSHKLIHQLIASKIMDSEHPLSPTKGKNEFKLPMPPPLLHTRSGNAVYDSPATPSSNGFTSPYTTPQGSPSKSKMPPGARDLPNVFDNAMKLAPSSPTKPGRQQLSPHSPNKGGKLVYDDELDENNASQEHATIAGSALRKSNKENAPPGGRQGKEGNITPNQAAVSRQEPYLSKDIQDNTGHSKYGPTRGLTPEELEKLQLPKVKRLANVTQLCRLISLILARTSLTIMKISLIIISIS